MVKNRISADRGILRRYLVYENLGLFFHYRVHFGQYLVDHCKALF
jgi:hypothetical protein